MVLFKLLETNRLSLSRPVLEHIDQTLRDLHVFLSLSLSVAFSLCLNTCSLLSFLFCSTSKPGARQIVWRPATSKRAQSNVSSKLAAETILLYLLMMASGYPFLGPFPLPSGIHSCVWSKSLQAFVVMPAHYAHTGVFGCLVSFNMQCQSPFRHSSPCLLKMPIGGSFLWPIREQI